MQDPIHILFSCNAGYGMPVTVSIASIFENHTHTSVVVHVLYSSLLEDQKEKLQTLANTYNQHINLVHVPEHYFNNVPVLRWSKETYYRLLIHELLPDTIEKILYLDCDIAVHKDICELFQMDLGSCSLAALPEKQSTHFREQIGLSKEGVYFQAGVILFDLRKTKGVMNYARAIKILEDIGDKLIAVDQDVINVMFDGKIYPLTENYNNCTITNFEGNALYRLCNYVNNTKIQQTTVFHYATGKPWNNIFSGSAEHIWYKYLQLSPYAYLYTEKYNTYKYKILRSGISKTIWYLYTYITPGIDTVMKKIFSEHHYQSIKKYYRAHIK